MEQIKDDKTRNLYLVFAYQEEYWMHQIQNNWLSQLNTSLINFSFIINSKCYDVSFIYLIYQYYYPIGDRRLLLNKVNEMFKNISVKNIRNIYQITFKQL